MLVNWHTGHAAAYGPYGSRGVAQAYNPRTGTYAQTRQGSNVYGSWGSTSVQRGDDWAKTNRYTNNRTGNTTRSVRTDEGAGVVRKGSEGGRIAAGSGGDIYAGKDGNVYRREDGTRQKHENGGWSDTDRQPAEKPRPTDRSTTGQRPSTMDRAARARSARTITGTIAAAVPARRAAPAVTVEAAPREGAAADGGKSAPGSWL